MLGFVPWRCRTRRLVPALATVTAGTLLTVGSLLGSVATSRAQTSGWRVVQTSDGSLYLVHDGIRQLLIPGTISDEDLATLPEDVPIGGDAFPDLPAPTPLTVTVVATPTPFPPPARGSLEALGGQRVTVLDVQRAQLPRPQNNPPSGTEWVSVRLRLDNASSAVMSTNPLNFPIQLANLVMVESRTGGAPDELLCCDLPPSSSVVGTAWYQVPVGVPVETLFWTRPSVPLKVDIR